MKIKGSWSRLSAIESPGLIVQITQQKKQKREEVQTKKERERETETAKSVFFLSLPTTNHKNPKKIQKSKNPKSNTNTNTNPPTPIQIYLQRFTLFSTTPFDFLFSTTKIFLLFSLFLDLFVIKQFFSRNFSCSSFAPRDSVYPSSSSSSSSSSSLSMAVFFVVLCMAVLSSSSSVQSVSSSAVCSLDDDWNSFFLHGLQFRCPLSISPNSPLQVSGRFLDKTLASKQRTGYTAVLFYASWCPFSSKTYPKFEALSSMFPQVEHLAIERSSAMPSVFSRYGIHSLPSILIVNQTSRVRYHGPKDLPSLVQFYEETMGLEPVQYLDEDRLIGSESVGESAIYLMNGSALKLILKREPYLVLSLLFLCLRVLVSMFPRVLSSLKAFWVSYVPHLNLGILGETGQIMGRVSHMIDVRGFWTKLRQCKTRSLCEGARNARVWASSLATVSLGKSSSARSSH